MNPPDMAAGNPIIDRLACGLVHSLWEGLLIAVALALLLPSLRGRPAARYAAGWLALVLMACSVPLTAWLAPEPSGSRTIAPARPSPPGRAALVAGDAPRPDLGGTDPAMATSGLRQTAPADLAPRSDLLKADPIPAERGRSPWAFDLGRIVRPAAPWTVAAWLSGIIVLSAWRLGGWLYLGRLCRHRSRPAAEDLGAALERLRDRLGVRCAVRLLESAHVHVPAVIGCLRPVVILPLGLVAGMAPQQVELILAHELAHIRRRDFFANLIQTAIETCLFYHPAVWWVSRMVRVEREACCDDLVVATTGERVLYARALARLAESCLESRGGGPRRLTVAADGGDLLSRVRRILGLPGAEPRWAQPRLAGSLAALATAAVLTGYAAVAVEPPTPAPQDHPKSGAVAPPRGPAGPPADGERPRVVAVHPADGATDVEPNTEIRIRFDRPMKPTLTLLRWDNLGEAGFRQRGPMRYDPAAHEFILPLRLTPGRTHDVTVNPADLPDDGFRAADGTAAAPYRWSFATAGPKPAAGGRAPRAVSVSPATDSEVAELTPVEVTFDRPMDPESYGVAISGPPNVILEPELADRTAYDPGARRFTLLLRLPPNWNGEVRLEGFRGAEGANAEPVSLNYRTLGETLAPALRKRFERSSESARFRALIERIREARRKIWSVSEDVLSTATQGSLLPDWKHKYWSCGATFKMRGDRAFVGVADEIMHVPYRVGSDGTACWLRGPDGTTAVPFRAIAERNLLFVDPFDAKGTATAETIIRERKLEDAGEVDLNGRRCHLIQSWHLDLIPSGRVDLVVHPGPRWYIDTATLRPLRIEYGDTGAMDFTYTRVNEPIPDDEFRPAAGAAVPVADPEPLAEGETHRFLNVGDGSRGVMSVRWGTAGPKGSSGGLNRLR